MHKDMRVDIQVRSDDTQYSIFSIQNVQVLLTNKIKVDSRCKYSSSHNYI